MIGLLPTTAIFLATAPTDLRKAYDGLAVLGASNKTYVEAFDNEQLSAWLRAHCHAWTFFEGVSRV